MGDYQTVATQFVDFYYNTFDTNRQNLKSLYRATSVLTFEGALSQGDNDIIEKLVGLPFQKVQHRVDTKDAQLLSGGNGLFVLVTGALIVDDSPSPLNYSQSFILVSEGGSFYVANDTFRLVYPA